MLIPHQKLNVRTSDILHGLSRYYAHSPLHFADFEKYFPQKNFYWTGSARFGLSQCLSPKLRVGLPSFTCSVLLDSIKHSQCTPVFYDASIISGVEFIKEKIADMDVLLLPYNMGFLSDISKIKRLCKQNNVLLIEDCATALGAKFDNQPVGSFGDRSVYSFNISKGFFLGGLVASNDKLIFDKGSAYPASSLLKTYTEGLLAQTFFDKRIYPVTSRLLSSELHKKQPLLNHKMPLSAKYVVNEQLKRFDSVLLRRRENASLCMSELDGVIDFVRPIRNSVPSWLYFVLLDKRRDSLIKSLRAEGVDIVPSYTFSDLNKTYGIAYKTQQEQMIFALDRPATEIEYIIRKIKKVSQ